MGGEAKLHRMLEYGYLFPDCVGRFVFIGDDGQADVEVAEQMLHLSMPNGISQTRTTMFAFVAVHAVQHGGTYAVTDTKRAALVHRLRAEHPPLSPEQSVMTVNGCHQSRHRFFYFLDYGDLAQQLAAAGWIESEQCDSILRAVKRDQLPDLNSRMRECDFRGLRAGIA